MNQSSQTHFSFDLASQEGQSSQAKNKQKYLIYTETYLPEKNSQSVSQQDLIDSNSEENNSLENQSPLLSSPEYIKWKTDLYDYTFNAGIFVKTLMFYLGHFLILGPIFIILERITKAPILKNSLNASSQHESVVFLTAAILPIGYFCFIFEELKILIPSIITLWMNILFVIICQASQAAFTNKGISELLTKTVLSAEQIKALKKLEICDEKVELRNTFNRLKINISSLYFNFMESKNEYNETMKRKIKLVEDEPGYLLKEGKVTFPSLVTQENLVQAAMGFEDSIFEKKCFGQKTHLDESKFFGWNLALDLLAKSKATIPRALRFAFCLVGYFQCQMLYDRQMKHSKRSSGAFYLTVLIMLYYLAILFLIIYIIDILWTVILNLRTRKNLMLKLGELITPGKSLNLNTFDYMSLRTWMSLRKAFMHYGDRQMETVGLIMTIFMGSHIIVAAVLFLDYMTGILKILSPDLEKYVFLFFLGGEYFVIFLVKIIYFSVGINSQYHVHRELMRKNRGIVVSMYRLYPHYVAKEPIEPERMFEAQALRLLEEEFGKDFDKEKMESRLRVLTETYDDILEELKFEEEHYPIKLVGVKITPNLIKGLMTTVISAGFAAISKYISNLKKSE